MFRAEIDEKEGGKGVKDYIVSLRDR